MFNNILSAMYENNQLATIQDLSSYAPLALPTWLSNPHAYLTNLGTVGLPMFLWHTNENRMFANAVFSEMLGDSLDLWASCSFERFMARAHPDERQELGVVVGSVFAGTLEENRQYELRLGHRLGSWLSLSLAFNVLSRRDGKAECLLFTLMDLTTSRAYRAQWRARAELGSDWFWETNTQQQITQMALPVANALQIDLSAPQSARFQHSADVIRALSGDQAFSRLKFSCNAPDGSIAYYEIDGRPVYDALGVWRGFEGVGRDVTQREKIMQGAQETVATLNAILDSIPIPIVIKDVALLYKKANEPFRRLLGVSSEELIGQRVEAMYDPDDIALHQSEDQRVLDSKVALKYEVQQKFPEIGVRDVLVQKAPILGQRGEVLGIIGMVFDVTAQRETERNLRRAKEEAEAASLSKSSFLATMSHEIRTPMNGVLGMAEMLAKDPLDDDQAEAVGIIRQSAANLLSLIDDILDFSKIDSGKVEIEVREVDVAPLVGSIVENLTPLGLSKSVRLRAFIGPGVPAQIRADDTRIRQVLTNLVGNAIKFSAGRGDIRGDVYLRVTSNDGETIRFDVIDNGIGIAAESIPKMFNAFTQAERSTTRRYGGTGLGLAISHKLAAVLGGSLDVKSEPGIGSEFTFKIPMLEAQGDCLSSLVRLNSIVCVLLESKGVPDNDLGLMLRVAGANVRRAKTIEHAQELIADARGKTVLISSLHERNEREVARDLASKSWPDDTYHLLLTEGLRKSLRMLAEKVACIDIGRLDTVIKAIHLLTLSGASNEDAGRFHANRKGVADGTSQNLNQAPAFETMQIASGTRVLVAEDDPINQRVISRQLKSLGVEVDLANNGKVALEMWRENKHYHAIITDMHMPEMDGYALASAIRAEEKGGEHLPILALTANAINGESFEAFQAGIDVYLTKPILLKDLGNALAVYSSNSGVVLPGEKTQAPAQVMPMARPTPEWPVYDKERFGELVGYDEEIMLDLLDGFFDDGAKLIDEISVHLYRNQRDQIKGLAHRLKSGARSVGAIALGELASHIESHAEKLLTNESQELAVRVQREFEEFLRVVKAEYAGEAWSV